MNPYGRRTEDRFSYFDLEWRVINREPRRLEDWIIGRPR